MAKFAPIHPGEILKSEFLDEPGLTALRFSRFFCNSPQFWLNLQDEYNLRVAQRRAGNAATWQVLTDPG